MIRRLLQRLHEARILSLIVEGGTGLFSHFTKEGLWDEARTFTGDMWIADGLPAPGLTNDTAAYDMAVGSDHLEVSINKSSAYTYVSGMDL